MPEQGTSATEIRRIARDEFGYDTLRAGQEAAMRSVLDGRDTLAVMPTGSGKSAIYQIAALLLPGPAIVISPLIALQRDQVQSIEENGAGNAALLNSTLSAAERRETIADLGEHRVHFLFLAPEQFGSGEVLDRLRAAKPALVVVDEAHCVSEWGHDFRPDYLKLGGVIESLGHPTVLALTATAAPPVRAEIVERLGMREPRVIVQGFDRPNIWLGVERFDDEQAKQQALIERVVGAEKPGIIYAATKKRAEEIAADLRARGIDAAAYHAGMRAAERDATQEAFMADEIAVIVATTAFGMGIDKPNVRFVFHAEISDSVDTYYQEIGRAGRDGATARAILFYRPEDLGLRRFFAGSAQVDADQIAQVAEAVACHDGPVDPTAVRAETGLSQSKLTAALSRLEDVGAVETLPDGAVEAAAPIADVAAVAEEAARLQHAHHQVDQSRIEMMRGYAELRDCRRTYILNYFGEGTDGPCGFCDTCAAGAAGEQTGDGPFPLNSRVAHAEWGDGTVMRYEGEKITVLFDTVGYKSLALPLVLERGILRASGTNESPERSNSGR
jgi:ATP-dependent DNA helicase RecQ